MLNALVAGGLSFVSGLFGRSSKKKHTAKVMEAADEAMKVPLVVKNETDIQRMVNEAMAAGFNPASVLSAGGLSAFTTQTTIGHNALAKVNALMGTGPTPSVGEVAAGALSDGFQQYVSDSRFATQMAAGSAANSAGYFPSAPQPVFKGLSAIGGGGALSASKTIPGVRSVGGNKVPASALPTMEQAETVRPFWFLDTDPSLPGSASVSDWGGEPAEWLYAPVKIWSDVLYTATGKTSVERAKYFGDTIQSGVDAVKKAAASAYGGKLSQPVKDDFSDPFPAFQW